MARACFRLRYRCGLRYIIYVRYRLCAISTLAAAAVLAAADKKPSDLSLRDVAGKKVQLRAFRGKIVVLNFWATWCGPCREEMPMIVESEKAWSAKGVAFIAVSLDAEKSQKDIPAFLDRYRIGFPVWTGATADDLDKLHMGQGVPDTAFLDETGIVVARILGEMRRAELDERLTWLTGDRKGPPPPALVNHL